MTPEELERYKRHLLVKEIGGHGQKKLLEAKVMIIGAGALGGVAATILAAAGVGQLIIYDDDRVELSNLQRQTHFASSDVGSTKAGALFRRLAAINPGISVDVRQQRWTADEGIGEVELVLDGCDNFETRFAVNAASRDACVPLISGAVAGWTGQIMAVNEPGNDAAPCYQCFVPTEPPQAGDCNDLGVVGAVTHIVAGHMALKAKQFILGETHQLFGRLNVFDGKSGQFRSVALAQDPDCPVCGVQKSVAG
ncbi:MAG: molybdopterin biosynthesis protein MoeB [Ponticaulis sp.]|nr:molybdopterin biosynthesis protein MoeB [Ponticaulis sp.]|tara:strand:+ start:14728 stop:15483 length:756 start_codon:yes stop_codon:yes gene_type:complete